MTLMLRLQVFAIVVAAASLLFDHMALSGVAPRANIIANDVIFGGFLAWWIGSIVWRRRRGVADDTPDGWYPHNLAVFWLGNAATVCSFWLLLPYDSESARLMAAMMCLGPVTVEVIGTVRTPPARRGVLGTWAPAGIPAGLIPWFVTSDDKFALTVSLFTAAFCGMLLLLREFLQHTVDAAYAAKAEAEAARDSKARFLAAASHDLGQPLQAARLFFDQALRARSGADRDKAAGRAAWAFSSMEQQLRQMLDHLKLEAHEVAPDVRNVQLGASIARVIEQHEPAARLAGARIVAVPTGLHARGDPALIERALGNYVANAIRHAAPRRVLVGARRHGGSVRLWVIDDGRGVAEADRAGLFQEYVQGGWSDGDEVRGGFGLGLASAQRMAELMGGGAGYDPRWRQGSAFWLELPGSAGLAS
jgi:signal transduction histidine kinase